MSVGSTNSSTNSPTAGGQSSTAAISALGPDAFLNLLTTQLKNQNPLDPIDNTQSIAQLAQFSQLQEQTNLSNSFSAFQQSFGVLQSANLIGKTVTVADQNAVDGSSKSTGTVAGVTVTDGTPSFTLKSSDGTILTDPKTGTAATFTGAKIISISG